MEEMHFEDHMKGLGHVVPLKTYGIILGSLLFLTIVTVAAAQVDFGVFNIVVAIVIASIKAGLVLLFFMHLKFESHAVWIYAFFPAFLLALLIGGVFLDNPFRADLGAHIPTVVERPIAGAAGEQHTEGHEAPAAH